MFQIWENDIDKINTDGLKKYGVIIVDEAQDFSPEEAVFLRDMLYEDNSSEFYIFYDDEQNIYGNNLDETLNNFIIDSKPYILTENLRNTKNIYDWAKIMTSLGEISFSNPILIFDLILSYMYSYMLKKGKEQAKILNYKKLVQAYF